MRLVGGGTQQPWGDVVLDGHDDIGEGRGAAGAGNVEQVGFLPAPASMLWG